MEEEESTLEVVRVQKPKQVANVVGIKQLMTAQVLIETNPFFVDRERLLEFFRKCCFTFGSHRRFEQKCRLLMDAPLFGKLILTSWMRSKNATNSWPES